MRNIFLKKLFIFVLLLSFTFIVGCDGKAPEEGYISKGDVTKDIISKFENQSLYTKYSVTGSLNYFAMEEDKVYPTVNKVNQNIVDLIISDWECSVCGTINEFNHSSCTRVEINQTAIDKTRFMNFMSKISTFIVPFYMLQWILVSWVLFILDLIGIGVGSFNIGWYLLTVLGITGICLYISIEHGLALSKMLLRITSFKKRRKKKVIKEKSTV